MLVCGCVLLARSGDLGIPTAIRLDDLSARTCGRILLNFFVFGVNRLFLLYFGPYRHYVRLASGC